MMWPSGYGVAVEAPLRVVSMPYVMPAQLFVLPNTFLSMPTLQPPVCHPSLQKRATAMPLSVLAALAPALPHAAPAGGRQADHTEAPGIMLIGAAGIMLSGAGGTEGDEV